MYGNFAHDTQEFRLKLDEVVEKHRRIISRDPAIPHPLINQMHDLRNEIFALLMSWIGQNIFETKFGINIPLSSTTPSIKSYIKKQ